MGWQSRVVEIQHFPGWPAVMTPKTAAAYLDSLRSDGRLGSRWEWWRSRDGFPEASHGNYFKREIDDFLALFFGYADPVHQSKREHDERFGCRWARNATTSKGCGPMMHEPRASGSVNKARTRPRRF